jgi:hypothetical protein
LKGRAAGVEVDRVGDHDAATNDGRRGGGRRGGGGRGGRRGRGRGGRRCRGRARLARGTHRAHGRRGWRRRDRAPGARGVGQRAGGHVAAEVRGVGHVVAVAIVLGTTAAHPVRVTACGLAPNPATEARRWSFRRGLQARPV